MAELDNFEKQIQAEVDNLREKFRNTNDLYREVCTLLFFRYGITPTTNKLYRFVRKGSMSVPTKALNDFWKELREKSKVRIEQPDLPADLSELAGELIIKLWSKSQADAQESLTTLRNEIELKATELSTERDVIERLRNEAVLKLQNAKHQIINQSHKIKELELSLINSNEQNNLLGEKLTQSITKQDELSQTLNTDIEHLHRLIKEIKEKEKNKLSVLTLDLSKEQSHTAQLKVDLNTAEKSYIKLHEQDKKMVDFLKTELGDLREKVGELNGKLQYTQASNVQLNALITAKEDKLKKMTAKLTNLKVQEESWSERIKRKKVKRFISPKRKP